MTKYYADLEGNYIGGFDGVEAPTDSVEVAQPPEHGLDKWNGAEWIKPEPSIYELKTEKQGEIDALEASQYMTRGEREGWLAMIESQAAAQSVPLDVLYAANPFYKKLKDVNTAVTALRAELKAIV